MMSATSADRLVPSKHGAIYNLHQAHAMHQLNSSNFFVIQTLELIQEIAPVCLSDRDRERGRAHFIAYLNRLHHAAIVNFLILALKLSPVCNVLTCFSSGEQTHGLDFTEGDLDSL